MVQYELSFKTKQNKDLGYSNDQTGKKINKQNVI